MLVIGENINATAKSVAEALTRKDEAFIANLAREQADAGADFIDVNASLGKEALRDRTAAMEWLVEVVQKATEKPLTIDSDDPAVIKAALSRYRGGQPIINSVTAESSRLELIGALAAEHKAGLVALTMGEAGIPETVAARLKACEKIMKYLTGIGMAPEQIYFDPLVLPIAVDSAQAMVTLKTLAEIKSRYPDARTVMGLSNISYGLPNRKLINRTFLVMAAYAGLDAVIINPLDPKAMSLIKVADMLTGQDPGCRGYLRANRKGLIVD